MRRVRWRIGVATMVGAGAVAAALAQRQAPPVPPKFQCPPGQTEVRPGQCQAPEFPPPSILDYRPRSTLVTSAHLVPRAKFPVVDIHAHIAGQISTAEGLARVMSAF